MSKPKEYADMTKDKLMTYTFVALLVLTAVSAILWWPITNPSGWSQGITLIAMALIAIGVAVGLDVLLNKVTADSPLNIMSAAVFGLIVALSYSLGVPAMRSGDVLPLEAPSALLYVAAISAIGLGLFKKLLRTRVNPAAAAKLVVFLPSFGSIFIAMDHLKESMLGVPALAGPIGYQILGENGFGSFAGYIVTSFMNPHLTIPEVITENEVFSLLLMEKFHGWAGGASSLAVIIVGIGLFVVCRKYIKWRITLTYLVTMTLMAALMNVVYPGDLLLRVGFTLFISSSIFLAFFMATDPATTPLTHTGQIIFGVGLGILTVLIHTYMNFFGGSVLALVAMNLITPQLNKIGLMKPSTTKREVKLPKAKQFTIVKTYDCIRCGECMRICCQNLSPILIKEAFDKQDVNKVSKLNADYCIGCGNCNYVCPSRIDLKGSVLRAKAMLRGN